MISPFWYSLNECITKYALVISAAAKNMLRGRDARQMADANIIPVKTVKMTHRMS
jgi:hypothetical protein